MKPKLSASAMVVIFVLLLASFYIYSIIVKPKTQTIVENQSSYIIHKGNLIEFRSLISDCKSVPVIPDSVAIREAVTKADRVILLFNPNGDALLGISVREAYKILAYLNVPTTFAYSTECNSTLNENCIADAVVLRLEDGTGRVPVILINSSDETKVELVREGQILITARNSTDMDSAVCAFDLSILGVINE